MDSSLTPFFEPKGVVVVGASADPAKLGFGVARNLVQCGYPGSIHFVNLRGGELFGRPVYPHLAQVPDPVDLAVMIVPAPATPAALEEVGRRGIRAAVIASAGFREAGAEGEQLETECLAIARRHGIRLIGPNCIGVLDYHLPLDTTFLPDIPHRKGDLGLISQSGAFCGLILDWAYEQGFGFSRLLSLGNQADVAEADMLSIMAEDGNTRALTMYIESVRDGQHFVREAGRAARLKPIVALKVGGSAGGQRAAASHTGALAGQEAAYEAAFQRTGVLRAGTIEEMFEWALALARYSPPKGRRMAVLTNAGGPGVIAADMLEPYGLELVDLKVKTRKALAALLPPAAALQNPVDMLGNATHATYAHCLPVLLADEGVDGVILIIVPPPLEPAEAVAEAVIPLIRVASKPVLVALMGGEMIQKAIEVFHRAEIPGYRFPERAIAAMAALARRGEFLRKPEQKPRRWPKVDPQAAQAALAKGRPGAFLDPESVDRLLAAYGIPTTGVRPARTGEEAAQVAGRLGFPVALKVDAADISHKSDAGGILLNVRTPAEASAGFRQVTQRVRKARPEARISGVLVQRMLPEGQEVILGAARDAQFGPLMMFGSGGVEVEGLKDVAFALAPLSPSEADELLRRTWAGRKLAGYRNIPPADAEAVKEILQRLALLACDLPQVAEIEINPLRVMAKGAMAVDVRVRLEEEKEKAGPD